MNRKVVTVTLNPAIDVTLWTDLLEDNKISRVSKEARVASGKGVNVSKVLVDSGIPVLALGIAGKDNADEYMNTLAGMNIESKFVRVNGHIRENITVLVNSETYKLNRKGPQCDEMALSTLTEIITDVTNDGDIAVFSGSLPPNMSGDSFLQIMAAAKEQGAQIVADSEALTPEMLLALKPFLIKPNIDEFKIMTGHRGNDIEGIIKKAGTLLELGVEHCLISMGKDGMLAVSRDATYKINTPEVTVKTTIGAGDSLVAGFITAYLEGCDFETCARTAVSYGTAAVIDDQSQLPDRERGMALFSEIMAEKL